ncbi:Hypothetical predicted protein [Mytilus galloprovincialis]|uniref:DUF6589 domain-containing protein n=1 Tax=Mytilus galloprovincialis TaxID=29158 RepID=A0A8B6EPL2_MYTGA|nr:Hypothetical predicted protein [Mytilus galloprovincialis]
MTVIGEHTQVKIPTVSYGAEKTARKSLGFSGKENEQNLPYEGEVKDIEILASIVLSVHPKTIHNRLQSWQGNLDAEIISLRNAWSEGGLKKYQLIGDNWDKNILPSFRTSLQKTLSLHLFNLIAVVDRITPNPAQNITVLDISEIDISTYLPSISEQEQLMTELTFIFATSVISNIPHLEQSLKSIYPKHFEHKYSFFSGIKTVQYPLGLFKCNENKTQELIRLLKQLTEKYVPLRNGEIFEPVFLGGDRLTDERVQSAQTAMSNADSPKEKLEGFISKIEDFHRLMNFLEAIYKLTYNTESASDKGTMHYYRNLLNMRNVKGKVKNASRPFKLLYYTILDAICLLLFLDHLKMTETEKILLENFQHKTKDEKIAWINDICSLLIQQCYMSEFT